MGLGDILPSASWLWTTAPLWAEWDLSSGRTCLWGCREALARAQRRRTGQSRPHHEVSVPVSSLCAPVSARSSVSPAVRGNSCFLAIYQSWQIGSSF